MGAALACQRKGREQRDENQNACGSGHDGSGQPRCGGILLRHYHGNQDNLYDVVVTLQRLRSRAGTRKAIGMRDRPG
jgi:hypothetical protein